MILYFNRQMILKLNLQITPPLKAWVGNGCYNHIGSSREGMAKGTYFPVQKVMLSISSGKVGLSRVFLGCHELRKRRVGRRKVWGVIPWMIGLGCGSDS